MNTHTKTKRPRISKDSRLPIHTQSVDVRLKKIKKELGFSVWDSICLQVKLLKTI
jgi:hypothetical protein